MPDVSKETTEGGVAEIRKAVILLDDLIQLHCPNSRRRIEVCSKLCRVLDEGEDVSRAFRRHKIIKSDAPNVKELRSSIITLNESIHRFCPDSRERDYSVKALEECLMWANKSIAMKLRPTQR